MSQYNLMGGELVENTHHVVNGPTGKFECKHNGKYLKLGKGRLYGWSGTCHNDRLARPLEEKQKDGDVISLFLDVSKIPSMFMYSNSRMALPATEPEDKIIFYHIQDRGTPRSTSEFKILVEALRTHLEEGGWVYVSCHGGHGRTGLILAILYGLMTGHKNPIKKVRKFYCDKAVESYEQKKYIHNWLGLPEPKEDPKPMPMCMATGCYDKVSVHEHKYCAKCVAGGKKQELFSGGGYSGGYVSDYKGINTTHGGITNAPSLGAKVKALITGNIANSGPGYEMDDNMVDGATDKEIIEMPMFKMTHRQWLRFRDLQNGLV